MQLPTVTGKNLERKQMTFPDDFTGQVNLVFIPFKRWHQDDVDGWVPFVGKMSQEYPTMSFYEFPTLPDSNFIYRTFLNEGMRAGIPDKATRKRTITLYIDKVKFRQALEIPNEDNVWIYLFDKLGNVLWKIEGKYDQEKGDALQSALHQILTDDAD